MVTIDDIARRAGLSKGAVSYALNGRPGVSEETRTRVLSIAHELGWTPNVAARSLTTRKAEAIGLVIRRSPRMLGSEPFYMQFIAGVEQVISPEGIGLMLHLVETGEEETLTHRKWWGERRVDGFLVVEVTVGDERPGMLAAAGIPAVVLSDPAFAGGNAHVRSDEREPMCEAVRHLARLGHTRIAHVGGDQNLVHAHVRRAAFRHALAESGLESAGEESTDFSADAGARATRKLLALGDRPTGIVFDNDIMAVAGLAVASDLGVDVPRELSLIAWDDSPLCGVTHPPLTAMTRDVGELGRIAARSLLEVIRTGRADDVESPNAVLSVRGTTAVWGG